MFWRFGGYANISAVDTLLDKPDVSLEELLDEPELISELKQHNTKLIEYLREDHILKKLLEYVVAPPLINDDDNDDHDDDDEKTKPAIEKFGGGAGEDTKKDEDILGPEDLERADKQRSKFAYMACEILSSETWSILESIMVNEAYLREFWDFIRRPAPLDSAQAGYFTKINEVLFDKKTEEMLEFFKSLKGVVPAILQHVDNPMVMDLLLKIISLEKVEGGQGIVDWLKDEGLIPVLLSYISSEHLSSMQTSAGDFLKAIITISANATQNEQSCIGPNSLTRQLVSAPCVEQLIQFMLQGGNSLTVGVGIVIEVIRKNNSDYDENVGGPDARPSVYDPIYLGTLLRQFSSHIPDFMALILSSKHTVVENGQIKIKDRGLLNSAWGVKIEPLGFDRFKTCELMAELLHCSNMGLLNEVGSEDYIRQRDIERENLRAQGAFDLNRKEVSGMTYSENAGESEQEQSSRIELPSATPEHNNVSDDDGFEDVGSSKDIGPEIKSDTHDQTQIKKSDVHTESPGLHIEDSIVEETLKDSTHKTEPTGLAPTDSPVDPISPTASGLTDSVNEITLDKNEQVSMTNEPFNNQIQRPMELSTHAKDATAPSFATTNQPDSHNTEPKQEEFSGPDVPTEGQSNDSLATHIEDEFTPQIQYEHSGQPVVGDYLKIQFVEHKVVPTILDFFFRFPWNNFLHNVVYDVVQQVFNGSMDRGYNRCLAIDLFNTGRITEKIVEGQKRSDEAQASKNTRLGYMGHLTLIAEEVVKFTERHPAEILSQSVMDKVLHPDWVDYVERTLSETRERDNAILGGVRPDLMGHRQAVMNAVQGFTGSNALANAGLNGGNGSNFENFDSMTHGSASSGAFGMGGSNSLLSGFGSSSDDEDEEMEDQDDDDTRGFTDNNAESGLENVGTSLFADIEMQQL
ncbi:Sit4-associated protein (Sap185), putative [Talaromyces stipitatus ATCC 10500]|uniref:Sit4-associated protein (Sap185), putative n=1 Tax=Talaromyces stipitatus (strain ATCC 10500 / CBS 375.48 / QM 6759 / NRRL 1006) TaxID=441959 RepID=B8LWK2_TALSN|nr:Sit4-associated protein (Sap185), putative [Talaromyces stipitatus ATCC 10500]EED24399.1 Sit4-associated protein (Sap185), putative [Talaromyces stipitatus ATCC 10500]